jgi:major intracellular serine protease
MPKDIFVALIDSGCTFETHEKVAIKVENNKIITSSQNEIKYKHGDVIGEIISSNENIKLYDIQVFDENLRTTPSHIVGALTYLLDKKVDVINMSLGLKTNYKEIEDLCKKLISNGVTIISSFPKSGADFVFPASYDEVISVTSDGKCAENEISCIDLEKSLFAANPLSKVEGVGGSSVAVAKFTKYFCEKLQKDLSKEEILNEIKKGHKNESK